MTSNTIDCKTFAGFFLSVSTVLLLCGCVNDTGRVWCVSAHGAALMSAPCAYSDVVTNLEYGACVSVDGYVRIAMPDMGRPAYGGSNNVPAWASVSVGDGVSGYLPGNVLITRKLKKRQDRDGDSA